MVVLPLIGAGTAAAHPAAVPARADNRTLRIQDGAGSIETKLNTDFGQGIKIFSSAEFALEMVKGVVKVLYECKNPPGLRAV